MGATKRELERLEGLEGQAVGVAMEAGAITGCDFHDGVTINAGDSEAERRAYAIGTNLVKQGMVDGSREEFMDAIKTAISNSGDECPQCAYVRDHD